jgi:hypothetical protein
MARQAGIARQSNICMAREAFGQRHRVALRSLQTHCQRPSPADGEECLECSGCCACEFPGVPQRCQQIGVTYGDHTSEQVRVSADELGQRLHSDIGAERQSALIKRRCEGVAHAEDRSA